MLEKRKEEKILETKEYMNIFNYFHNEYTQMLKTFLQRHEIAIKEDDCLIDYIIKTRFFKIGRASCRERV